MTRSQFEAVVGYQPGKVENGRVYYLLNIASNGIDYSCYIEGHFSKEALVALRLSVVSST
jgi:hypothetical protein